MARGSHRWDHLFEQRPIPLQEHLLEEAAKLLANELRHWPPPIDALDSNASQEFQSIARGERPRPPPEAYRQSFQLTRWELLRELAAYDDYIRNQRWTEHGLSPAQKAELLYLSRWMLEKLMLLREQTRGRINRDQLAHCLRRAQDHFEAS